MAEKKPLLVVEDLVAGYNAQPVLKGVSLEVNEGEIVGLIGLNGSGKSTLLKTVFGLLKARQGRIIFDGKEIQMRSPLANLRDGIVYCPQGNRVFYELTVEENLSIGTIHRFLHPARSRQFADDGERVFELFPVLRMRQRDSAGALSGGEKQKLAIARALLTHPRMLLIDEPSLGLAFNSVQSLFTDIANLNRIWKVTILLVEQRVDELKDVSSQIYGLCDGSVILSGLSRDLSRERLEGFFHSRIGT